MPDSRRLRPLTASGRLNALWLAVFLTVIGQASSNQSPQFINFPTPLWLYENVSVGTSIARLEAVDTDDDTLWFSVVGDIAKDLLELVPIGSKQVDIKLRSPLDREVIPDYTIVYEVRDVVNVVRKPGDLYILDVNDNAPTFINMPYRADVPEDAIVGSFVYKVSATDPDLGLNGLLNYNISSQAGIFAINEADGTVTLNQALDYEQHQFFQLEIMAFDNGEDVRLSSTVDLLINVKDVPDTAPFFLELPYLASVYENATVGSPILGVSAMDGDLGIHNPVNYSFVSGDFRYFAVDPTSGTITVSQPLDRENPEVLAKLGVMDMVVQTHEMIDPAVGPVSATAPITIRILDVNDQTPTFSQSQYTATVLENTQARIPVTMAPEGVTVNVNDLDKGDNGRFELLLQKDGQPFEVFEVVPNRVLNDANVLIRVLNSSLLNFEAVQSYTFDVVAREYLTPEAHQSVAQVTVNLEDVNDNWPVFASDVYNATIDENPPRGLFVATVTATDDDSEMWGQLSYGLRGSNANLFYVDPSLGHIFVNVDANLDHSLLDREKQPEIFLTYEAQDGGGLRTSVQLRVILRDVNDNAPEVARSQYEGYVRENEAALDRPLVVEAIDMDLPPNNLTGFFITAGDPLNNFTIDYAYGTVSLKAPLDYEAMSPAAQGRFLLTAMARDMGTPPLNSTVTVLIHVQDVNDETPVFLSPLYTSVVAENSPGGTNVTHVLARDLDGTAPNNEILYRIESGARDQFRINANTGLITVESGADLDHDRYGRSYSLRVVAIDKGTPALTGVTEVKVDISDVNDKFPVFDPPIRETAVSEGHGVGHQFYNFTASDLDDNALLRYKILDDVTGVDTDGADVTDKAYLRGLFGVQVETGIIYINNTLDRETAESIWIKVLVQDINAQEPLVQTATGTLLVVVTDTNDNNPFFIPGPVYRASLLESAKPGVEVARVTAIDKDIHAGPLRYYIQYNSVESTLVEITDANRETGVVTLKSPVDRETYEWINVTVMAMDSGSPELSGTAQVNIYVEDVNDNSPVWETFNATVSVPENATAGTVVTWVYASDLDSGDLGQVMYFIIGGGDGLFAVGDQSGILTTTGALNRELASSYQLTLEARDNNNQAEASLQRKTPGYMTVVIADLNDNAPQFSQPEYSTEIQENIRPSTTILTIRAADPDEGPNGEVRYEIDVDNRNVTEGLFGIDPAKGDLFVAQSLKGAYGSYYLTVVARDNGAPAQQTSVLVFIFIEDVNDHPPEIVEPPNNATILLSENLAVGVNVTRVRGIDQDSGDNGVIRYRFVESSVNTDWRAFHIDDVTGLITTATEIDREIQENYFLEVQAYDLGEPRREDRRTLTIYVTDVDDNPPLFSRLTYPPPYTVTAVEEASDVTVANLALAQDPDVDDNAFVCYFIVGGDRLYLSQFQLNKTTAELTMLEGPDREQVATVALVIKATQDCYSGYWELESNRNVEWNVSDATLLLVHVQLSDVNDNAPVYSKHWFTAGVTKDTQYGTDVIDLSEYTLDADEGDNTVKFYHIESDIRLSPELQGRFSSPPFTLGMTDGILRTNVYFQDDMQGYIEFTVNVTDNDPTHVDRAEVSIYLLHESQRVRVVIRGTPEEVGVFKDPFANLISNITGAIINVDMIRTHKDAVGMPDNRKTDFFMHGINPETGEVLDAWVLIDMIDKNYEYLADLFKAYNVIEIVPAVQTTSTSREGDLLLAIIIVAVCLVILLIIIIVIFCVCRKKYRRKLKAATAMAFGTRDAQLNKHEMPGTNVHAFEGSNPIWLEQYEQGWPPESDTDSKDSMEENAVEPTTKPYDEQELSLEMYNDDFDHYNKIPGSKLGNSDRVLQAALQQHDAAKRSGNNLNNPNRRKKGSVPQSNGNAANGDAANHGNYDNLGYNGYDNVAYKPDKSTDHQPPDELEATEI